MANIYDVGDLVQVAGTFTNAGGTAVDPGTVTFKFRNPSGGSVTTLTYPTDAALVKSTVGLYYYNLSVAAPGNWHYQMRGQGDNAASAESYLTGKASYF